MTILSIAQSCASELGLPAIAALAAGTSNNVLLLKQMFERAAQEIRDEASFPWPELQTEHTFTLATDVASYALPADIDRILSDTLWNRTQGWPLMGPTDPVQWQLYKSGLIASIPRQRFRVKGWGLTQFFIDPTPSADENGETVALEYISKSVFRPKTWVAATSWTGNRYCSYNGYIFDRGSTGAATTGTDNAPTPSDLTDGTITWTLYTGASETINHDTDECILDPKMIRDGAIWRFKREIGLDYAHFQADAESHIETCMTKLTGASVVSMVGGEESEMIGLKNYPEGSF